ncbi:pyridoxamine 5'-phosphate oxidase family protein [Streptosporangium sp. NPDC048047]|uniref:pyridoxamine 5'-phosphate oxidase family protein n=1 Tax=Streptosporangium sp. NPDC048047 TaxID=3155748 RepID=UPI0034269F6B
MDIDSIRPHALSREECMKLLSSAPIGRIVFTDRALPAVEPVDFCVDGGKIVICTDSSSKVAAATRDTVVAFEADDFDTDARTGWSVTALGRTRTVQDPEEVTRLTGLPLTAWAAGCGDHFIVLHIERISGRRLRR